MTLTRLAPYIVSVDDTFKGTSDLYAAETLAEARTAAERRLKGLRSGSVVIRRSSNDEVLEYFES